MQFTPLYEALRRQFGDDIIRKNVRLDAYTTFQIGGPGDVFVEANHLDTIRQTVRLCREMNVPLYLLGNGSNVLVRDRGIRGCVLRLDGRFAGMERRANHVVFAQAGVRNDAFAAQCAAWGLAGCEFLSGIPGTLGGALFMNAGAYHKETSDLVVSVQAINRQGDIVTLSREEMGYCYRTCRAGEMGLVILGAELQLSAGEHSAVLATIEDLYSRRSHSQPLEYPSAGSMFKRPAGHYAAALIDQAGLKGFAVGAAQVSEKHAGFVINRGGATAAQVEALVQKVTQVVAETFGVTLEPEVRFWGEPG